MNNRSPGKVFCLIILFCLYLSSALYAQTTSPGQASTGYGSTENYITSTFASYELGNFNNGTQLFYYIPDVLKNGTSAPAVIFLHGMFATTASFSGRERLLQTSYPFAAAGIYCYLPTVQYRL